MCEVLSCFDDWFRLSPLSHVPRCCLPLSRPTLPSIKRIAKQLGHSVSQLLHGWSSEQLPGSVSKLKFTESEHIATYFTKILTDNRLVTTCNKTSQKSTISLPIFSVLFQPLWISDWGLRHQRVLWVKWCSVCRKTGQTVFEILLAPSLHVLEMRRGYLRGHTLVPNRDKGGTKMCIATQYWSDHRWVIS